MELGQNQGETRSGSRSFCKSTDLSCRWVRYERQQGYGKGRRKDGSQWPLEGWRRARGVHTLAQGFRLDLVNLNC